MKDVNLVRIPKEKSGEYYWKKTDQSLIEIQCTIEISEKATSSTSKMRKVLVIAREHK